MSKLVWMVVAMVLVIIGLPLTVLMVINMATTAATACDTTRAAGTAPPDTTGTYPPPVERVVVISVDGLSAGMLRRLGPGRTPRLHQLMSAGASTWNARTMVEKTVTLPNHVSMVTGRPISKTNGGHGVTWNRDKPHGPTVQQAAGEPVPSMFTQAASSQAASSRDASTLAGDGSAVFSTKTKFSIFADSWPEAIDRTTIADSDDSRVAAAAAGDLRHRSRALTFVHFGAADEAGHAHGWDSTQYRAALAKVDALVGTVVDATRAPGPGASPGSGASAGPRDDHASTAVILTADHGGTGGGHGDTHRPGNYTIPFAVTGPGITHGDLYALNPDYVDPGRAQPGYRGPQPIRNGDVANAALRLLTGRQATVPGSMFGATDPLDLVTSDSAATDPTAANPTTVDPTAADAGAAERLSAQGGAQDRPAGGVPGRASLQAQLMRLRFSPSSAPMTAEQANNAITIAQVARGLEVPAFGLQVAIATGIQESRLLNLDYGDRDSVGVFQQRPSGGWGTIAQIRNVTLASRAFFGRAAHTDNVGLLDIEGWQDLPLTVAAQRVQRSAFPDAYAQWESGAYDIAELLGGELPAGSDTTTGETDPAEDGCPGGGDLAGSVTMASFNILGAGHTPGKGYAGWASRLPRAMAAIEGSGATIAGLQEVHPPQGRALKRRYSTRWGMWPRNNAQNKVIWDKTTWRMTTARGVPIPYFRGKIVAMPLVQLTNRSTGESIWMMSIHNPVSSARRGQNARHRYEALRRQAATFADLKQSGDAAVILGDFNDGRDGRRASHCAVTPLLDNAFGGTANPCREPKRDAPIDHIYGTNLTWAEARVDRSVTASISDHPLVVASTRAEGGCPPTGSPAEKRLTPDALTLLRVVDAKFGDHTYYGVGERSNNPASDHPAGRAVDIMIEDWAGASGRSEGGRIAAWLRAHAEELGVTYLIWRARIWSLGDADWRPYSHPSGASNPTLLHMDHVHASVSGTKGSYDCGGATGDRVVYPVPESLIGTDRHNWHDTGSNWDSWHTGTDFSVPCGTPIYAARAGTIEVTDEAWAGQLVKITTGPDDLTTWYAHMQQVTVTRGASVRAGQMIGRAGAEGNATGCHLHFEVHLRNGPIYGPDNVDPSQWLAEHVNH